MGLINETMDKVENATFLEYEMTSSGCIPALWELYRKVDVCLGYNSRLRDGMFVYYERFFEGQSILAFRMPESESNLIFERHNCIVNNRSKAVTTLRSMKGDAAWPLLVAVVKEILPFFECMEEFHLIRPKSSVYRSIIDFKTGKSKLVDIPAVFNPVFKEEERRISM